MESILSAQFVQNLYNSVTSTAPTVEDLHQSFQQALTSLLESASILAFFKETEGRNFGKFAAEKNISVSHANKLVGLLGEFGEYYEDLQKINPLTLTSMLGATHSEAREVLPERIEECQKTSEELTCADITALKKAHAKPKSAKKEKKVELGSAVMIANQQGGTGIFRIEAKEPELANQLQNDFKESGFATAANWLGFVTASNRTLQNIASVLLGRRIESESEFDEFYNLVVGQVTVEKESIKEVMPVVEVVQSVEPCVAHSEWRPLVELVQQNNSLIGLKAVVALEVGVIGEKLQNIFSRVKGKVCVVQNEPIISSSLNEAHIWVRFEDFGAQIIPLCWLNIFSSSTLENKYTYQYAC